MFTLLTSLLSFLLFIELKLILLILVLELKLFELFPLVKFNPSLILVFSLYSLSYFLFLNKFKFEILESFSEIPLSFNFNKSLFSFLLLDNL